MKRVGFIFGTRPEAIKCVPVILEARKQGLETKVIFTGQHLEMALPILNFFDINIDINLNIMKPNQTLVDVSVNLLNKLDEYKSEVDSCDVILVQGDTTSAFIGGYYCFLNQIPVGHIEAGLRTNNLKSPFPEEGNRQLLSKISNYHFAPTPSAFEDLKAEGITTNIYQVGNTGIDTLLATKERLSNDFADAILEKNLIDKNKEYVLVTGHRRENLGQGFKDICYSIKTLAKKYTDLNFIYPVHMNPKVRNIVNAELSGLENVKLIEPLDYIPFVSMMSGAKIIMTDSGGIQEEAPSFKKPIVVMRDTTERPEGVSLGIAKLCGTNPEKIIEAFDYYFANGFDENISNPYGDGKTSERIITTLINKHQRTR